MLAVDLLSDRAVGGVRANRIVGHQRAVLSRQVRAARTHTLGGDAVVVDIGVVTGFTDTHVHVRTLAGDRDLPFLSTYRPVLDEHVTIDDGVVIGPVIATGPAER